jgi:hypothetical protein
LGLGDGDDEVKNQRPRQRPQRTFALAKHAYAIPTPEKDFDDNVGQKIRGFEKWTKWADYSEDRALWLLR